MHNSTQRSAVIDGLDDLDNRPNEKRLPLPDVSQMVPYKPKLNAFPGEHIVPGNKNEIFVCFLNIINNILKEEPFRRHHLLAN